MKKNFQKMKLTMIYIHRYMGGLGNISINKINEVTILGNIRQLTHIKIDKFLL